MFGGWESSAEYPTLYPLNRRVWVDTARVLPASGIRQDQVPLWLRAGGLRIEPRMLGRQIAWLRRCDGGWLAVVEVSAGSSNSRSQISMTLWLSPEAITPALDSQP